MIKFKKARSRSIAAAETAETVSRRDFIASVSVATVATSVALSGCSAVNGGGGSDYDVIVVGGGMAGVSAARETSKAGLKTILLEARNRLGGRTFFAPFGDEKVELGANYLYWLQPHIWAEVNRYQLPIIDTPAAVAPERWIYLKNGKAVEADIATLWPKVDRALTDYCGMSREVFERPYDTFFNDKWKPYQNLSIQDRLNQMGLDEDVRINVNAIWSAMSHAKCNEGGFLEMLRWWANLGSNSTDFNNATSRYKFEKGTISLIDAMINDGKTEVKLSTPVKRIEQKGDRVKVTTEEGQTLTARKVVLAAPLNTWADFEFEPALAEVKLKTSKERHVGNGNKLHVKTKAELGNIFLTADDSFGPLQYGYTEKSGPEGTTLLSYGLDGSFDVNNLEAVQTMLRTFIPDLELEATFGYQWAFDPFSKGTWCTLRPHQFALIPELQKPEGNIHFATSDIATMWRGWMDGGIEMGVSTGQQIAKDLVKA